MTSEEKKYKMFSLVSLWRASGLTRKEFALQHGLQVPSFNYWCKLQYNEIIKPQQGQSIKLSDQRQDISPSFIELVAQDTPLVQNSGRPVQIELQLPNGIILKIY
jgi:hypothetical protein